VAREAGPAAASVICLQADLSVEHDVDALLDRLRHHLESVDILVHAAGVLSLGSFEDGGGGELDRHYRTNLRAPYVLTRGLLPQLRSCRGQVVFVNSTAGLAAKANMAQYAASKHALKAVADSLREEVNAAGVRVLSLFLGRTATEMQAFVHRMEGRDYRPELLIQPQDVAAVVIHTLGLPRSVEVTDISMRPLAKSS
jgi:NADP-dependent 3-hydroxy acid dehydrogenase YdfG